MGGRNRTTGDERHGRGRGRGLVLLLGAVAVLASTVVLAPPASAARVGPFPSEETFVQQQYRDLVGREADLEGYARWLGRLERGEVTAGTVVGRFLTARRSGVTPVVRLYLAWFDRMPGYRKLARRVRQLRAANLAEVSATFAASGEAATLFAGRSDRDFVVAVYQRALDRRPERSERALWVDRLRGGMTRAELVLRVSRSSELRSLSAGPVATVAAHAGLLRRSPTGAELSAGNDAADVLSSGEYADRIKQLCNGSYPDFCIPSKPPDLDCDDSLLAGRTFAVSGKDPHELDRDDNGVGCDTGSPPPPPPPGPSGGVINIYNDPWNKLVLRDVLPFSTARQVETPAKRVRVKNVGSERLDVTGVVIEGSSAFRLVAGQARAFSLAPNGETTISVEYRPGPVPGTAKGERHVASMFVESSDAGQPRDEVFLRGWHAREYENNVEPSRAEIAETIGYTTNLGSGLPRDDADAGPEELRSAYWRRAPGAGPVELFPLARYSSRTTGRTGETYWYPQGNSGNQTRLHTFLGCQCADATVNSGGENQKLVPTPEGGTTIQASGAFGISLQASGERMYSDDSLNGPDGAHNFRFWPARDRERNVIPNTWIVGNDLGVSPETLLTKNWDYQDFMWVLSNAQPA
ncbi:MAG: DUF4214 domain-containing protein [Acidimicrobiia bacterium]|nr:DUF4214 domain-containing protein [Acidimicrobiia bacterium]